jgi:hypothetical protein
VARTAKGIAKRAGSPLLAALDRRMQDLAVRLERHTSNLALDQSSRLDRLDERVQLDLRVVDEHLLAISRATSGSSDPDRAPLLAAVGDAMVLVAPPGVAIDAVPEGYRVVGVSSFTPGDDGTWRVVSGDERIGMLRIARLAPSP